MDQGANVSTISCKPSPTDNSTSVYINEGYSEDDVSKKQQQHDGVSDNSSNNISAAKRKISNSTPNLNNTQDGGSSPEGVDGGAYYNVKKDGGGGEDGGDGGGDAAYCNLKKDGVSSSNVDFTLPVGRGRERSKSIQSDGPYRGMGKEELLRFSSRPLWRNLRYACMSIVLTGWLALLITVVALVLTYPHCRDAQRKDWWQKTVIYRVYVPSFRDNGTDGIGDINGTRSQLNYLKETGVGTISLSPIYTLSDNAPGDTHIVNHMGVDPMFGTMDDLKDLINETHAMGMNIILDFIPNHTSDKHPWFNASRRDADERRNVYRSYYIWQDGLDSNGIKPPNKWQSVYNCTAWTFTTEKNSHYLHQFLHSQPELNLRSEKVRQELEKILKFWLDIGVDGFYIRDTDFLFEDYDLRNEDVHDNSTTTACNQAYPTHPYDAYTHSYTKGLTEVFDMLARWRAYLDDYGNKTNKYKMLIADVDGSYDHVMDYYGRFNRDGVDFPLNKFSLDLQGGGKGVASMVKNWLDRMPPGRWANWMGGDDRSERLAERLGPDMAMPYLILTMLLPGTPYLYYGDEIGMQHSVVNSSLPGGAREMPMRGPMLWNSEKHAGFCPGYCQQPWLAPDKGYDTENRNVKAQKADPFSMWHLFKNLTQLRKDNPSFEYGDYVTSVQDDQVFSFVREFDGEKGFLIALNFANTKVRRDFTSTHDTIPSGATIDIVSGKTSRRRGDGIDLDPMTLEPYQGIVVSWAYKAKEI